MGSKYFRDKDFLKELDKERIKTLTVKITILTWDEHPICNYTGKVLPGGIVNLDGSSNMRRTCNLNFLLEEDEINITQIKNIISINKKVKIEIGVDNTLNKYSEYKIIWYPLGIYIIVQPNISRSTSGITVSLQLKDKMCLLNGEFGGILPASITFNEMEYTDDEGNEIIESPTIFQIIMELVNHWGGEQISNIIVTDVPLKIKKVVKWNNENKPVYISRQETTDDITGENYITYIYNLNNNDGVIKEYGEDIGFIYSDFIWPEDDLIGDVGNTVCNVLDKLVQLLGNFEYFYDLDGRFRFREKKNYLNTTQATTFIKQLQERTGVNYLGQTLKEDYQIDLSNGKSEYVLDDNFLINSYNNSPQYNMIKNDFLVWGMRTTTDGTTLPIRYHLAIDKKPEINSHLVVLYTEDDTEFKKAAKINFIEPGEEPVLKVGEFYCDVSNPFVIGNERFIPTHKRHNDDLYIFIEYDNGKKKIKLHRPQLKTSKTSHETHYNTKVIGDETFQINEINPITYVYSGDTNVQVYADFYINSGIIYYDNTIKKCQYKTITNEEGEVSIDKTKKELVVCTKSTTRLVSILPDDWRTELYLQGVEADPLALDRNYYYTELINEWPKIYDIEKGKFKDDVLTDPTCLDYFLDFIDTDSKISEFNINNIGRRTLAQVEDKVNCIFATTPFDCVIFENTGDNSNTADIRDEMISMGQAFTYANSSVYANLIQGGTLIDAFSRVREMLYQYTSYCESITIQCIPIYHLDVNTRITVKDPKSNIFGDYFINKISMPLDCNGMMSINATRAIERI